MQSVKIEANQAGQRLDKFLHKYLPQANTSFLYKMLRKKNITLNGKKAEGREILQVGDEVKCFFSEETFSKFSENQVQNDEYRAAYASIKDVQIIYEDEHVVFLNKPVGVLSQKAKPEDYSLNEWLIGYLLTKGTITEKELTTFKPSVCNRLDRNTSGMVLCGKSLAGSRELSRLIKERSVKKFYHTICCGKLEKAQYLEGYLIKNHKTNKVTFSKTPKEDPEESKICTAYKPLEFYNGFTLLEVELITGKTHQIRAHLAGIGHCILGDGKYGRTDMNQKYHLQNQFLHAYRIEFPNLADSPLTKLSNQVFLANKPESFRKMEEKLKG